LMVKADSGISKLSDLKGKKIGIAGGPLDKSWLILRAYAQQTEGLDLKAETEQVFGAPPLIFGAALNGEVDAAINFWHFQAKMEAAGMVELQSIGSASEALGLDPQTPLLGYVVKGEAVDANPALYEGFAHSSQQAKALLANDPAAWDAIRDQMNAKNDAQFDALKAGYIAGIPNGAPIDQKAAEKMLVLMAELGGEELVGSATHLPEGVFLEYAK
jgi:NitT/TauT family transport system substrate-binding protein